MLRFYKSGRQVIELLGAAHSFRKSGASASLSDRIFLALNEAEDWSLREVEGWSLSEVEGPAS